MENLNLCEILKGHEGETFYSPCFGKIGLMEIHKGGVLDFYIFHSSKNNVITIYDNGKFHPYADELCVFPSKDQRDWNKWVEKQNDKTPETWSELIETDGYGVWSQVHLNKDSRLDRADTLIEKSALALLKIHKLIEAGYGGNITNEEWNNIGLKKYIITPLGISFVVDEKMYPSEKSHIAFHTQEQARAFLKHQENIQLLNDYYMI